MLLCVFAELHSFTQKIVDMVTTFSHFARYPKQEESKFFDNLKIFTTKTAKRFHIFCKNSTEKSHLEVQDNFSMTDDDFQVSDRAWATVATSDLKDHGVFISNDPTFKV